MTACLHAGMNFFGDVIELLTLVDTETPRGPIITSIHRTNPLETAFEDNCRHTS